MGKLFIKLVLFFILQNTVSCYVEFVDLTWEFNNETIYWPGQRPFEYTHEVGSTERGYWYSVKEFCAAEHGGTHFDAPYHFNKNGWKVSEVPEYRLFSHGAAIELNKTELAVEDLENWEREHIKFKKGTILIINTRMGQYWNTNRTKYLGLDSENNMNFPGLSPEAATWIANSGKFYGVGIDTISIDPGRSTKFEAHRILAAHQIYILENVALTGDSVAPYGFQVIVAPMKLGGGSGAPVRIFVVMDAKLRNLEN
ncbi:uncharacterized protein LOC115883440 [Sitophilus oryzae]|uniref:Uncharacterized protein LOC115883440 n=1 Tax=Sitophilus oryzae TaxID=7048 RepID=A0A6J2Y405_SITOR|nr:uncharacterized protein LOC115883440 [Sitophilus oryzae]